MTDPVDVNADSPEFREARMPETRTLVERLRKEAGHDAVEIPDMTKEESLSWRAADKIERLTLLHANQKQALINLNAEVLRHPNPGRRGRRYRSW